MSVWPFEMMPPSWRSLMSKMMSSRAACASGRRLYLSKSKKITPDSGSGAGAAGSTAAISSGQSYVPLWITAPSVVFLTTGLPAVSMTTLQMRASPSPHLAPNSSLCARRAPEPRASVAANTVAEQHPRSMRRIEWSPSPTAGTNTRALSRWCNEADSRSEVDRHATICRVSFLAGRQHRRSQRFAVVDASPSGRRTPHGSPAVQPARVTVRIYVPLTTIPSNRGFHNRQIRCPGWLPAEVVPRYVPAWKSLT